MPTALGYVDHRPFAGLGARLIFGRRPDGCVVRIDDVSSGLACGCVCPAIDCSQPLIASKGEKVAHHFRHASGAVGCSGAETSAHIWAKQVLEQEKAIWLPAIRTTVKGVTVTLYPKQKFMFDAVRLETRLGEVLPDVVLSKGSHDLIVEVRVTHACGPEKIAKLEASGTSTLEVDLSAYRTCEDEAIRKAILETAPRYWLVNPKLAAARQAAQVRAAELDAEKRRAAVAEAVELRRRLVEAPKIDDKPYQSLVDAAEALGLGHLLEGDDPTPSAFAVSTRTWRAAVIIRVIYPATASGHQWWQPTVDLDKAAEEIRDLWAIPFKPKLQPNVLRALSRQTSSIVHPVDAVRGFINILVKDGLLTYAKGAYSVPEHHREALREGAKAIRARAKRSKEIGEKVDSILKLADDDELARFRREDWMRKPPPGFSMSPADLIDAGGEEFKRLDTALYQLQPLPWQRSIPGDAVGLPVDRHLVREAEMARIVEEAAEAVRQAEAEKVRLNRIDRITAYAQAALGWTGREWLDQTPGVATITRLSIAGASDDGYQRVKRGIDRVADDRRVAQDEAEATARRQAVLRRKAHAMLSKTHAAFFLENARRELGRRTPLEACSSGRGLDEALALLPRCRRS